MIGLFVLALVWAYSRHTFDAWLGLGTQHNVPAGGVDLPIAHTGNGYGKVYPDLVHETGPVTGPTGPVGNMVIYRPTEQFFHVASLTERAPASGGFSAESFAPMLTP